MPDVENARVGGADDLDVTLDVLAVEGHVFTAPTDDVLVEATYPQEIRSVLFFQKKMNNASFNELSTQLFEKCQTPSAGAKRMAKLYSHLYWQVMP